MKKLALTLLASVAMTSFSAKAEEIKDSSMCKAGMKCPMMEHEGMDHSKMPMAGMMDKNMMGKMDMGSQSAHHQSKNTIAMELTTQGELEIGKTTKILVKLAEVDGGKPVGEDGLKLAHTRKLHLLINDPTLMGYQHIHPVATKNAGEWAFNFTPTNSTFYQVWADVIPTKTGNQEYVISTIGKASTEKAAIDKAIKYESVVDGYKFKLSFDGEVKAGEAAMGKIVIENAKGEPLKTLEPVMGAFAHIVGFGEDFKSIVHIHPMGTEPTKESERGGPELSFHVQPESSGFMKLYAQVKINGKEIFAPFGVEIK